MLTLLVFLESASKLFRTGFVWIREHKDLRPNIRKGYTNGETLRTRLLQEVLENPDATLEEFSERFSCHPSTIHYHLTQLGVTRKKNHLMGLLQDGYRFGILFTS